MNVAVLDLAWLREDLFQDINNLKFISDSSLERECIVPLAPPSEASELI